MKNNLLFLSAFCVSTLVSAQEQIAPRTSIVGEMLNKQTTVRNNDVAKAALLTQDFTTSFGGFTRSKGGASTAPGTVWEVTGNGATYSGADQVGLEEYLVSPEITIPASYTYLRIASEININPAWFVGTTTTGRGGIFEIDYTIDNGTTWVNMWKDTPINNAAQHKATATLGWEKAGGFTPFTVYATIPAGLEGETLKFRYAYKGTNSATVYVDNVVVDEFPEDAVVMNAIIPGDLGQKIGYVGYPLNQADFLGMSIAFLNYGKADATRAFSYKILKGAVEVATGDIAASRVLPFGTWDTLKFLSTYKPTEVGDYKFIITETAGSNVVTHEKLFKVTPTFYEAARIDGGSFYHYRSYWLIGQTAPPAEPMKIGTIYEIKEEDKLGGMRVAFGATTVPQTVTVEVHKGAQGGNISLYEGEYTIPASEISSGGSIKYSTILFEDIVEVFPGDDIILSVKTNPNTALAIVASDRDDNGTTICNGAFGVGGATGWFVGFDVQFAIGGIFQRDLAVTNVKGMENVTVFPNPSTGIFNITSSDNEVLTVSVKDIAGKEVSSSTIFGNGTVDLANFGAGVYILELSNGTNRSAQRVVVK